MSINCIQWVLLHSEFTIQQGTLVVGGARVRDCRYTDACSYLLGVSPAVTPIILPLIKLVNQDDFETRAATVGQ
jgi:hypothetical protein